MRALRALLLEGLEPYCYTDYLEGNQYRNRGSLELVYPSDKVKEQCTDRKKAKQQDHGKEKGDSAFHTESLLSKNRTNCSHIIDSYCDYIKNIGAIQAR